MARSVDTTTDYLYRLLLCLTELFKLRSRLFRAFHSPRCLVEDVLLQRVDAALIVLLGVAATVLQQSLAWYPSPGSNRVVPCLGPAVLQRDAAGGAAPLSADLPAMLLAVPMRRPRRKPKMR